MESEICSKKSKMEKDGIFEASELLSKASSLLPAASTPDRNNDQALLISDSPLTWVIDSDIHDADNLADLDSSPRTPKSSVFDPFAPGPDDLMLAPLAKKLAKESKNYVVRRLNFGSENLKEDEVLLDKMYESFLDAIVEGVLAENFSRKEDHCSGFRTPTKLPLLTGIAETCPPAPRKSRSKLKNIDLGLCRKLEF